jgi:hypothetical protein
MTTIKDKKTWYIHTYIHSAYNAVSRNHMLNLICDIALKYRVNCSMCEKNILWKLFTSAILLSQRVYAATIISHQFDLSPRTSHNRDIKQRLEYNCLLIYFTSLSIPFWSVSKSTYSLYNRIALSGEYQFLSISLFLEMSCYVGIHITIDKS